MACYFSSMQIAIDNFFYEHVTSCLVHEYLDVKDVYAALNK